jgi:hypothetical protein
LLGGEVNPKFLLVVGLELEDPDSKNETTDIGYYITIYRLIAAVMGLDKENTMRMHRKRDYQKRVQHAVMAEGFIAVVSSVSHKCPNWSNVISPHPAPLYLLAVSHPPTVPALLHFCLPLLPLSSVALEKSLKLPAMSKEASDVVEDGSPAEIANGDLNRKKKQVYSR